MASYYKVPKREEFVTAITTDDEGNTISEEQVSVGFVPDIPDGVSFVGSPVGENYFIKVATEVELSNGVKLKIIPENLLKSKVRGVK